MPTQTVCTGSWQKAGGSGWPDDHRCRERERCSCSFCGQIIFSFNVSARASLHYSRAVSFRMQRPVGQKLRKPLLYIWSKRELIRDECAVSGVFIHYRSSWEQQLLENSFTARPIPPLSQHIIFFLSLHGRVDQQQSLSEGCCSRARCAGLSVSDRPSVVRRVVLHQSGDIRSSKPKLQLRRRRRGKPVGDELVSSAPPLRPVVSLRARPMADDCHNDQLVDEKPLSL